MCMLSSVLYTFLKIFYVLSAIHPTPKGVGFSHYIVIIPLKRFDTKSFYHMQPSVL